MLSISGTCKIYMELFVPENIFFSKPHVIMKVLRSQALPVVRKRFDLNCNTALENTQHIEILFWLK